MLKKIKNKYDNMPIQVRASIWFLFSSFLAKAMSSITTPIFTRLMSTEEYGRFGVFSSWQGILANFITLNMFGGVYTNGVVKFEKDRKKYVSSMQGLSITLVFIWMVIFFFARKELTSIIQLNTIQMICLFVITWEASVFKAWSVGQRTDYKYKKLLILTVIVTVIRPTMGILFVLLGGRTATARIFSMAIVDVLSYTWLFIIMLCDGKVFYSRKHWSYAIYRNIPLIPHYLSITVLSSVDRIMISRMVNDASAGIYNLAYQIAMVMNFFSFAMLQTIEPWIYRKLKEDTIDEISKLLNVTACFISGVLIIAIAFAPEILRIFAPIDYFDAIYVIPPVVMSILFTYFYTFFATYEFYKEKSIFIVGASCIGAILNIILNFFFIRLTNYKAAGYTTLICYILFAIGHGIFSKYLWRCDHGEKNMYNYRFLIFLSILFVSVGFLFMSVYSAPIIRYTIIVIMFLAFGIFKKEIIKYSKIVISVTQKK